jgi:hypothetical protein
MKWTVAYSSEDELGMVAYAPVEVPPEIPPHRQPEFVKCKFVEIWDKVFGDTLGFVIREIHEGYERKEPHAIV